MAANSFAVFVTNANILHALDRKTGRTIWTYDLRTIPTSSPAADNHRVVVGMTSGKLIGFNLKKTDALGNEQILTTVLESSKLGDGRTGDDPAVAGDSHRGVWGR